MHLCIGFHANCVELNCLALSGMFYLCLGVLGMHLYCFGSGLTCLGARGQNHGANG